MFKKSAGMLFLLTLGFYFSACSMDSSGTRQDRTEGAIIKCITNEPCPPGQRCNAGLCEDIYHPRRTIKTF